MRDVRRTIFLITVMLVCVGIVMIYSASSIYAYSSLGDSLYFLKRHLLYLAVGFSMMLFAMVYDLKKLQRLSKPIIFA